MISNKFLFYGPKGCGKSLFASAMFGEFSKTDPAWFTVEIKKAGILESPVDAMQETFSAINQYQVNGIMIEDIDLLLSGLSGFPAAKQILIEEIKKIGENQILIATTRSPDKIDESVLSQFDLTFPFYYPSEINRQDILRVHTQVKRQVLFADDVNLSDIANRTSWFSGADIENVVLWASKTSCENQISLKIINEAINFIASNISLPKRIQEMQELVDFAQNHCTLNEVKEDLLSYAKALDILKPSQHTVDKGVDLNKILELKPNFCGLGLNINEVIEAVRRKFSTKVD